MEFKFRAIDDQPQPSNYQSSSSSSSSTSRTYFTEQAIRVGYSSTDSGRPIEFMRNPINVGEPIRREFEKELEYFRKPMDFREAMQREIEKQRIREEIIATEVRKRLLEEEVRRELFMERELAMGRSDGYMLNPLGSKSLEGRIALSLQRRLGYTGHCEAGGVGMVPFQRNVEPKEPKITEIKPLSEVSKDKLMLLVNGNESKRRSKFFLVREFQTRAFSFYTIKNLSFFDKIYALTVLAKPDSNLSVTKRKALTPPTVGLGELPSIVPKKKLKEDWICSICEISTTSELALSEHLEGKKHKAKEARLIAQSTGQNIGLGLDQKVKLLPKNSVAECSGINHDVRNSTKKIGENTKTGGIKKNTFKFWCEMCQVGAHSGKVINKHKKGKKHMYLLELNKSGGALPRNGKEELVDALENSEPERKMMWKRLMKTEKMDAVENCSKTTQKENIDETAEAAGGGRG
ncbi:hypothetical protein LguiA_018799 [Lonicera macranthoides]